MPYRLVLDVPTILGDDVRALIDQTPQAEVIMVHRSSGPGAGEETSEITVVAHSLDVIDRLYHWLSEHPEAGPTQLKLLGGPWVRLTDYDPDQLKARIEGEERGMGMSAGGAERREAIEPTHGVGASPPTLEPYGLTVQTAGPLRPAEKSLVIEAIDHIGIRVANMRRAEDFYHEFFQMDAVLRARQVDGGWENLPPDYDWDEGLRQGVYADLSYLTHPPLSIVLLEAGRGAIFDEPRLAHISLRVSPGSLLTIRAQALVRSFAVTEDRPHSFVFRDPFGVTWHLTDGPAL